jgi:hypothetical protein
MQLCRYWRGRGQSQRLPAVGVETQVLCPIFNVVQGAEVLQGLAGDRAAVVRVQLVELPAGMSVMPSTA